MTVIAELETTHGTYRIERVVGRPSPRGNGLYLTTFELPDGRAWCIRIYHGSDTRHEERGAPERLRSWSVALERDARAYAAIEARERFLPEILAYVRNLPSHCRSDYIIPVPGLEDLLEDAIDDVRRALGMALAETDPYRASVTFERATPYLTADVGIVDMMKDILPAFARTFGESQEFSAAAFAIAAAAFEKETGRENAFSAGQIDAWHRRRESGTGTGLAC